MRPTETPSHHRHLETKSTRELLEAINQEDQTVALVVGEAIPQIEALAVATHSSLAAGGRLFYLGAGTSGRLGVVDASECPPTYGVPHELVTGLIAGGDSAIRRAVEFAEDDQAGGWRDLSQAGAKRGDVVVGLAASGSTPYVVGGLRQAREQGLITGCVTCNPATAVAAHSDHPVEVVTGPEFVTGSTRMKAGTAQKLVLNMLTTTVMIRLGRVLDNRMVDMQLSNDKLWSRANDMLREQHPGLSAEEAKRYLEQHGSVRAAASAVARGE